MSEGSVTRTADPSRSADGGGERIADQLLCIVGDRSFVVTIPPAGIVIGRGPDAGLSLDDALVSRAHAQLIVVADGLQLADLGSRHGTLVNGERIAEPRLVGDGDVIAIGGAVLVVRRARVRSRPAATLTPVAFVRRLGEEVARVAQYERELALVVVRAGGDTAAVLAAVTPHLRVLDTAAIVGPRTVAIVLPELDGEDAAAFARQLAAIDPDVRVGIAVAPSDGIDPDALLAGARAACEIETPARIASAREAVEVVVAGPHRILVADPAMVELYALARRLARATIPISITGETGSGKELAAAAIHAFSPRAQGPFISVNCAAIPESLAESELFGHAKGAFSGAVTARAGHVEAASGGTLFLDEIGELTAAVQAKLLRVLESGEVVRIGESTARKTDLRIVAATNRDLQREVDAGRFRSDLYFRLGAARLELPPLRDRPRDLAILASVLLEDACRRIGRPPLALSIGAAVALFRHAWPGNIRELRHVVEYAAAAVADTAPAVELWHLPPALAASARAARDGVVVPAPLATGAAAPAPPTPQHGPSATGFRPIADEVRELERTRMVAALRATGGVRNQAADLIEMPLRTFVTKLKRYAVRPEDWS